MPASARARRAALPRSSARRAPPDRRIGDPTSCARRGARRRPASAAPAARDRSRSSRRRDPHRPYRRRPHPSGRFDARPSAFVTREEADAAPRSRPASTRSTARLPACRRGRRPCSSARLERLSPNAAPRRRDHPRAARPSRRPYGRLCTTARRAPRALVRRRQPLGARQHVGTRFRRAGLASRCQQHHGDCARKPPHRHPPRGTLPEAPRPVQPHRAPRTQRSFTRPSHPRPLGRCARAVRHPARSG